MKQGLFEVDDEYSTQFNSHFLVMSPEVMRALSGCSLSTDEFFKIDKTGALCPFTATFFQTSHRSKVCGGACAVVRVRWCVCGDAYACACACACAVVRVR